MAYVFQELSSLLRDFSFAIVNALILGPLPPISFPLRVSPALAGRRLSELRFCSRVRVGRPKLFFALYSLFMMLDIDTEDCESWNSLVKIQARAAPQITAELMSARVNMKCHCGHSTALDSKRSVKEVMKSGGSFLHALLKPFAEGRSAAKKQRRDLRSRKLFCCTDSEGGPKSFGH